MLLLLLSLYIFICMYFIPFDIRVFLLHLVLCYLVPCFLSSCLLVLFFLFVFFPFPHLLPPSALAAGLPTACLLLPPIPCCPALPASLPLQFYPKISFALDGLRDVIFLVTSNSETALRVRTCSTVLTV